MQRTCQNIWRCDPVFLWILLSLAAFAIMPSYALDYGVWDATSDELLDSYGWSNMGVAWLWFAMPLGLLVRPWQAAGREAFRRHAFDAAYATLCGLAILVSATLANRGLGYSTIVLYTALGMVITLALSRLDWMGGDRFVARLARADRRPDRRVHPVSQHRNFSPDLLR